MLHSALKSVNIQLSDNSVKVLNEYGKLYNINVLKLEDDYYIKLDGATMFKISYILQKNPQCFPTKILPFLHIIGMLQKFENQKELTEFPLLQNAHKKTTNTSIFNSEFEKEVYIRYLSEKINTLEEKINRLL